jgi:hypothetical protein
MDVNYNPITKYNLHGRDLTIVLLIIVLSDDMQWNVKCKLDFDDLKSISQKNPFFNASVIDNFLYNFFIVVFIINSLYMWKLFIL